MIPYLGALIEFGKGVHDKYTLPERIAKVTARLSIPVLKNPHIKLENEAENRFVFKRSIREASLLNSLDIVSGKTQRNRVKALHFEAMRKELEMNKPDLEKQNATKADVAILGLALQEVALCLDEHVDRFKKSGNNQIGAFKTLSQNSLLEQQQREAQMTRRFEAALNTFHEETISLLQSHRKNEEKLTNQFADLAAANEQRFKEIQHFESALDDFRKEFDELLHAQRLSEETMTKRFTELAIANEQRFQKRLATIDAIKRDLTDKIQAIENRHLFFSRLVLIGTILLAVSIALSFIIS